MPDTLLVIEDEALLGDELARHFRAAGWETLCVRSLAEAEEPLAAARIDPLVVLTDMSLPDGNALDLLERLRAKGPASAEWIVLTGYGTIPDSVRALRLGVFEFLEKPCPTDRLDLVVAGAARSARAQRRLHEHAAQQHQRFGPEAFLGRSAAARQARDMLRRLAGAPFSTLVLGGETGTGKGLAARILHHAGLRAEGPLIEVNCAALPRELLESELFGHEAGAFTGARGRHRGLLEQAHGGTLFLDEIGEMDTGLQAKLLKAIEDRRIRRVGGDGEIAIDAQIVAASNRDLADRVAHGDFRQDLYHRLAVLRLDLPPLRGRLEDLEELVPSFLAEFNASAGRSVRVVPDAAWERMRAYDWPGNVRELRNVIERCVLLASGEVLPVEWLQLPEPAEPAAAEEGGARELGDFVQVPLDGRMDLEGIERFLIQVALRRAGGNVTAAARLLGTTRQTLRYRIRKHGLRDGEAPDPQEEAATGSDA